MKLKAEKKRQQIIDAARSCFSQFGYDRTTLDDIGLKMGLNKSSLYYYFKNKEDIYTEVVYQEADRIIEDLQKEMSELDGAKARILFYMNNRLSYYRRVLNLHKLSAESLRQIQPRFHELYDNILQREIKFIAVQLKDLTCNLDEDVLLRISALIISAADGIKHDEIIYNRKDTYIEPDYAKIEQETKLLVELLLLGVKCIDDKKSKLIEELVLG